jgi:hypothetical protein
MVKNKDGKLNLFKINMKMLRFKKMLIKLIISIKKHKIGPFWSNPTTRNLCKNRKTIKK